MGCFSTILFLGGFVMVMVSFIRWFEQATEAVDRGWWNKTFLLLMCPFTVWFFPSRSHAGRATPVPRHEPVRGFGGPPRSSSAPAQGARPPAMSPAATAVAPAEAVEPAAPVADQPPPGTPKEFIGLPKIPPPKQRNKPAVDAEKLAKLKQKMREQGMLPPEEP